MMHGPIYIKQEKMFKFLMHMRITYERTPGVVKCYNFLHTETHNYGTIIENGHIE